MIQAITLLELNERVSAVVNQAASIRDVWVVAELSDVGISRGHCYMELLQKDPNTGQDVAKVRAIMWRNVYAVMSQRFMAATGQTFASGMKVMVQGSINYSPRYGMSFYICNVNPEYTMGDLQRRRNEMIAKLRAEGIFDMNRTLQWVDVPQRIAVISSQGAAGYGDFINQLYKNPAHLRFTVKLFPAVLQGDATATSVIAALEKIASEEQNWDGVVIIRGGGSTSDLASFDNYDLAAHVAQFPLPVVVGIGHERDITILDYVANMRVKTPTAAAEWLIARGETALTRLHTLATSILQAATDCIAGTDRQLAYYKGLIPTYSTTAIERARNRVGNAMMFLSTLSDRRISPALARLDHQGEVLSTALTTTIARQGDRLNALDNLLQALSPQATLRRGYSITRVNGVVVTKAGDLQPGDEITTTLASGNVVSVVK